MKCFDCDEEVLESEIYGDFYYCFNCLEAKHIRPERSKRKGLDKEELCPRCGALNIQETE